MGSCKECAYSHKIIDTYECECRKNAPNVANIIYTSDYNYSARGEKVVTFWPRVRDNDWCGQWEEYEK